MERCGAGQVYPLGTISGRLNPLGVTPESICGRRKAVTTRPPLAPSVYIASKQGEHRIANRATWYVLLDIDKREEIHGLYGYNEQVIPTGATTS